MSLCDPSGSFRKARVCAKADAKMILTRVVAYRRTGGPIMLVLACGHEKRAYWKYAKIGEATYCMKRHLTERRKETPHE